MSSPKEIGGYFELEIEEGRFLHDDLVRLNSGRNSFEYILRVIHPTKVYFPRFTCDVMLEPLNKLGIEYSFYSINNDLEIINKPKLKEHELILYTNYFGIKGEYSHELSKLYKESLVLDCSQAYYFKPLKAGHTFYSPRKFFGVSDGGLLKTDEKLDQDLELDISYDRVTHLIERLELGAEAGYKDFKRNDDKLVNQPIRTMSILTQKILGTINFDKVKKKRHENAVYLHSKLGSLNQLKIDTKAITAPMVYPLLIDDPTLRDYLIHNKIFIALYWPNVLEWCKEGELEYYLSKNLLPLPIDQRYSISDMEHIVRIIKKGIL